VVGDDDMLRERCWW